MKVRRAMPLRVVAGLGTLALVAAWLVGDAGLAKAAFPGRNGKVYCASSRSGNSDIWAFDPTGVEPPRQLTFDPAADLEATPSPDGTRIAFTSTRAGGDQEIWIMYADGSGAKRLTFSPGEDRPGTFSPSGLRLAFHTARFPAPPGPGHSSLEVATMNIDGTDVRRLTNNNFQDSFAHWSPMGDRIAITTNRDSFVNASGTLVSNFEIYSIGTVDANADGNADIQTRVTNSPGEDAHAHWSPDASQLTFHSRRDFLPTPTALQIEIYRANSTNGSNAVRLTGPDNVFDVFPAWSPDGQKIVWSNNFPSDATIMNASDGSAKTSISTHPADDSRCDWGRLLACTITGAGQIFGTAGDDVICGSSGADAIYGLGGNDVIYASGGNDRIAAGAGADIVFAGFGNDIVAGEGDNDTLFGDQGADNVNGGAGNDIASGSEESDQVAGGPDTDECYGEVVSTCENPAPAV